MNKRIKELAEQVGFGPVWFEESLPGHPALPKEDMLKEFAELIIRECISIIGKIPNGYKDYRNQIEDAFRDDTIAELKQHFGVEE